MSYIKSLKFFCFFSCWITLFVVLSATNAQTLTDSLRKEIHFGIDETINNQFSEAETRFRRLIATYPEHPAGYFYTGATIQAEILDREDYARQQEFDDLMEKTVQTAESLYDSLQNDPWLYFLEGSAHLYRSFMSSKRGKSWAAYRNATRGVNRLEKSLAIDSTFFDAYMGVGSYKYWKSSKTKGLSWLPFVSDDREKGIRMVKTSIKNGEFVSSFGKDQLAWIYIDAGRMDAAEELALQNCRRYPDSRFFKWTLVEIYFRSKQFDRAYQLYQELLETVRSIDGNNHYNETDCLLKMAEIDVHRGNFLLAEKKLDELLAIAVPEAIQQRLEKRYKRARELKTHCRNELAESE